LTVVEVKGKAEGGARAGSQTLSLLSVPLNVFVLQALAGGPMSLLDLRREVGSPPQTTMRGHLRVLAEIGVLAKRRRHDFPGALDYELTAPGRELLAVTEVLGSWLAAAPAGSLRIGSVAAKSAIKALVEAWSTNLLRALAARPLSLTELNKLITSLSYPSLERRLAAMRLAGQIEACPGGRRGRPYAVTGWLRLAVGPLAAAASWERRHTPAQTAPITRIDAETAFLLAVPPLSLPTELSGSCRLAMQASNGNDSRLAGVMVGVEQGRITSCVSSLRGEASAWVSGSAPAWLRAVIDHETDRLEVGGDSNLATALVERLHTNLFRLNLTKGATP
jgi:DNA-binding HxlR family transcriptional regulator